MIEPLQNGYGMTLGNSLRRVLLSSIAGAGITSFKIDGVTHEFTTIKGVKEDVVAIMLNLNAFVSAYTVTMRKLYALPKKVRALLRAKISRVTPILRS